MWLRYVVVLVGLVVSSSQFSVLVASPGRKDVQQKSLNLFVPSDAVQRGYIVELGFGLGLNLSFVLTGERIERIWLDDLSEIVIDLDRPLPDARIIHLRRIQGIDVPLQLRAPSRSTLLTAVTNYGNIYKFIVRPVDRVGNYQTVHIMPQRDPILELDAYTRARLSHVERGLQIALEEKRLRPDSPIVAKVREFLVSARQGKPVPVAAQEQGLMLSFIHELARLGLRPLRPVLPKTSQ